MNPFRLAERPPRMTLVRLGLGAGGLLLFALAARKVDWSGFLAALSGLRWKFVLAGLGIAFCAISTRALRLKVILGAEGHYPAVWRSLALGYLGATLLPMGGGELLKIGALRAFLGRPAAEIASGAVLDRLFDLLGLGALLGTLFGMGAVVRLRPGVLAALGVAMLVLIAAVATGCALHPALLRDPPAHGPFRRESRLFRALEGIAKAVARLSSPAVLARALVLQAGALLLDLVGIFVVFQAFPFLGGLSFLTACRLGAYLMLGAALPMLPGGLGAHQVACLLALQPAGVTATQAFAFSVVNQVLAFGMIGLLGGLAAWGGGKPAPACTAP